MRYAVFLTIIAHGIHLILHQCNQWRNHYGGAIHDERRQLITQRFAATCGHEHKGVVLIEQVFHDFGLITLEGIKTEIFLQFGCQSFYVLCHDEWKELISLQI